MSAREKLELAGWFVCALAVAMLFIGHLPAVHSEAPWIADGCKPMALAGVAMAVLGQFDFSFRRIRDCVRALRGG